MYDRALSSGVIPCPFSRWILKAPPAAAHFFIPTLWQRATFRHNFGLRFPGLFLCQSALFLEPCLLQFSDVFREKYPQLVNLSTGTEGKWISQIDPGSAKTKGKHTAYEIQSLGDYRRFLVRQGRFGDHLGPVTCSRVLGVA